MKDILEKNGYTSDEDYPIDNPNIDSLRITPFAQKYSNKSNNPKIEEIKPESASYLDSLKAEFLTENTVASVTYNAINGNIDLFKDNQNAKYNFMNDLPDEELGDYENYLNVSSKEEFLTKRRNLQKERELRQTLANTSMPVRIFNSLLVGITDPINWTPLGYAGKALKAGKYIRAIGTAGIGAGISQGISEGVLQSVQDLRTPEESAYNIAGATLLGGLFGSAGAVVHSVKFNKMAKEIDNINSPRREQQTEADKSIGAAQVDETKNAYEEYLANAEKEGIKPIDKEAFDKSLSEIRGNKFAKGNAKLLKFLAPNLRAAYSESKATRESIEKLVNINLGLEKNNYDLPTAQSVETAVMPHFTPYFAADKNYIEQSKNFFQKVKKDGLETNIKNQNDFDLAVSREISGYGQSDIPEVKAAAESYRKAFMKTGSDLKEAGFKVEPYKNYKPRDYNQKAIKQNTNDFKSIIREGLETNLIPSLKKGFHQKELGVFTHLNELNTRIAELEHLPQQELEKRFLVSDQELEMQSILKSIPAEEKPLKVEISQIDKDIALNQSIWDTLKHNEESLKKAQTNKPKSLLQFIKENGGIYDEGGELASRDLGNQKAFLVRKTPTDLRTGNKITFDDVALRAWENGYFPHLSERPTINDLLDSIDQELKGNKIYSENDLGLISEINDLNNIKQEYENLGITLESVTNNIKFLNDLKKKTNKEIKNRQTNIKKEEKTKQRIAKETEKIQKEAEKQIKKIRSSTKTIVNAVKQKEINSLRAKIKRIEERHKQSVNDYNARFGDDEEIKSFLDEAVNQITDNIQGLRSIDPAITKYLTRTPNSSLKRRSLWFIPDQKLENYLNHNIKELAHNYILKTSADIELRNNFPTDDVNLTQTLKDIEDNYSDLSNKIDDKNLTPKQKEKEKNRLKERMKDDINIISTMRDVLKGDFRDNNLFTGTDTLIGQGLYYTRHLNYVSKLGGVTVSSLPDISRIILEHGSKAFYKNAEVLATNLKGFKLAVNEAKLAGNIAEIANNANIKKMAELINDGANKTQTNKVISKINTSFTKLTGMPYWNDFWHAFTSISSQRNILDYSVKWSKGSISKEEKLYLTRLGIGQNEANLISREADKFDIKNDGALWIANSELWQNKNAKQTFYNALNKDINSIVYVRGIGEVPLFMNTNLGKTIMQFKSFALAGVQQSYLRALQKNDVAAWSGIVSSISIGMAVYYLKEIARGREPDLSPQNLIKEGIDRSGSLGILSDYTQLAAVSTGLYKPTSRYQSRNAVGTFLGPSFGTYQDLFTLTSAPVRSIQDGNLSEADKKAILRNLPYANLFYVNYLYNNIYKK